MEPKDKTCQVCFESSGDYLTLPCSCSFCAECLTSWIDTQISELKFQQSGTVLCPSQSCKKPFDPSTFMHKLSPSGQNKINDSLLRSYLLKTTDIRVCPNNKCTYGGVIDLKSKCKDPLECDLCNYRWKEKVQFGFIEQMSKILMSILSFNGEIFSDAWEEIFTNRCPRCEIPIYKNGGCTHMTCKGCSYEFCWVCLHKYHGHIPLLCFWTCVGKLSILIYLFISLCNLLGLISLLCMIVCFLLKVIIAEGFLIGLIVLIREMIRAVENNRYLDSASHRLCRKSKKVSYGRDIVSLSSNTTKEIRTEPLMNKLFRLVKQMISRYGLYIVGIIAMSSVLLFTLWYWSFFATFFILILAEASIFGLGYLTAAGLDRWMQRVF